MNRAELFSSIKSKESFLCVGLDTDLRKIPQHLLKEEDPIFTFNKAIIDATADLCVAYKPNIAFYESEGSQGWGSLQKTLDYIPKDILTIADAKRGDIGNTADMYAKTFFETYGFDAVTVAPYIGEDSVKPFLEHANKWTILLALTSNMGSSDFQMLQNNDGLHVFETVIEKSRKWGNENNLMFVVGATRGELIERVRKLAPDNFFLVPGVGAQGGSFEEVVKYGLNDHCGLLVNSSRGIIYNDSSVNFANAARSSALTIKEKMQRVLNNL